MSGANRVSVKIFKREYTVSGEKSRDYIVKIADYVDSVMTDISEQTGSISLSSLAVLSAVNITEDLFAVREELAEGENERERLQKDIEHYTQLWEEAKRNFLQNKEDSQTFADQMAGVQEKLNEKAIENDRLLKAAAEKDRRIEELSDEKNKAVAEVTERKDRKIKAILAEKDALIERLTKEKEAAAAPLASTANARLEELARERDRRIAEVTAEKDAQIGELGNQVMALSARLKERGEGGDVTADKVRELSDKYKELEGNYFEIQMENIRLKGEIERLNSIIPE
jgi:cell division protein ZapA (FtsZ GTPase activity inhibitor)